MQNAKLILQSSDFITMIALYTDNISLCALRSTCQNYKNAFNIIIKKYLDRWYSELIYIEFNPETSWKLYKNINNNTNISNSNGECDWNFIHKTSHYYRGTLLARLELELADPCGFVCQRRDIMNTISYDDSAYN
jgi:hypothetical protein